MAKREQADRAGKFDAEKLCGSLGHGKKFPYCCCIEIREAFAAGRSAGIDEAHAAVLRLENSWSDEALADAMDVIADLEKEPAK